LTEKLVCLAGGVGAAKFLQGLIRVVPEENVTVIVNTGDDMNLYGLHISPDPDIIIYTLAGIVDEDKGWGMRNDTFNCLQALQRLGLETWFKLGDRDLGTHIYRTQLLKKGYSLDKVTQMLCKALGLKIRILPMTNEKVEPQIITSIGKMHFERYLVERGAKDKVLDVVIEGAESAHPAPGVTEAILEAEGIIICPSNPIVSIGPILAIGKIRKALRETGAKVVAISPIIADATVKGPADKLMRGLGLEPSAYSVASLYRDFLDAFILDEVDMEQKQKIEALGMKAITANTIMQSLQDKTELARLALETLEKTTD
jgi:LPPG:FO 2-phospho-L-lactate transferase